MNRQELINLLINEAHNEVACHNYKFADDAKQQLQNLVSTGVDKMFNTGRSSSTDIRLAVSNIRTLCRKLCDRADASKRIVENKTFSAARSSICPIWPFC